VMPPLVDALARGADLKDVRGLVFRGNGGEWIATPPVGNSRHLDDYPLPARHLIEHYADRYYINFRKPLALLETARGCPFICNFPHLIEMWKDCGDLAIFLGLESVTDEGLKAVNKKNTADNNVRALNLLKEMGVGFTPNFIVDPAWTLDDFKRLRDWIDMMG